MTKAEADYFGDIKKVKTVLGNDAAMPAPDPDPFAMIDRAIKLRDAANKLRGQLLKNVEEYENALGEITNATKAYKRTIAKWKFDLDESKSDEKKKIAQARVIMTDPLDEIEKQVADRRKDLDDIETALAGDIE